MTTTHMTLLVTLLLVTLMTSQVGGQQITCFQCQASSASWYQSLGACGDGLAAGNASTSGVQTCQGNFCIKQVVKYYTGGSVVTRYCANLSGYPSACVYSDSNAVQGWAWNCVCNTNYCNSANRRLQLTNMAAATTLFLSALFVTSSAFN